MTTPIEPPDLFDGHVPERYEDQAPKLRPDSDGSEHWVFEGKEVAIGRPERHGVVAQGGVGLRPELVGGDAPGGLRHRRADPRHEPQRRVRVDVLPEHAPASAGGRFQEADDKDLALVMLKAYNDWHIEEWCGSYPGRFIPLAIGPVWDMDELVAEVHRVAAKGCRAITMPELPHVQGLPTYQSDYWDPFFAAVSDEDVVVCLHIGMGLDAINMGPDLSIRQLHGALHPGLGAVRPGPAVGAGACVSTPTSRSPSPRAGSAGSRSSSTGSTATTSTSGGPVRTSATRCRATCSASIRLACFISDPTSSSSTRRSGSTSSPSRPDYPHSDSLWPDAPEVLLEQCNDAGCSDEDIDKISWANVAGFCSYDPFAVIPKEQATVGALRAEAAEVETGVVSRREWRARCEANPTYQLAPA